VTQQPAECLTLVEVLAKVEEAAPYIDDKVEWILRTYPDLTEVTPTGRRLQLGKVVGIALLDFLAWAYGHPDLGYRPSSSRDC
jgi:hypothetical protein